MSVQKPGLFGRLTIGIDSIADTLYNAGDIVVNQIRRTGEYKDTGSIGERFTYNAMLEHFGRGFIFRNVYVEHGDGKLSEIDLLGLNSEGIFVIESKNYSGWIFGNSEDRYWTAMLPNRQKNRFYNPIRQNATHIAALRENLNERFPQIEYYSLIVFSERCELKKIANTEPNTYVFQRQELHYYLKQLFKQGARGSLSQAEIDSAAEWLRARERPDDDVRQQHLAQVEEVKNTCPRCGRQLALRHSKQTGEEFLGCTGFPKCRYTSKPNS
jgi:hypothetical protein